MSAIVEVRFAVTTYWIPGYAEDDARTASPSHPRPSPGQALTLSRKGRGGRTKASIQFLP